MMTTPSTPKSNSSAAENEMPPSSASSSSSTSSNGGGRKEDGNEMGKQIVELISRLINEADPETEKINIEFTLTPFQMNKTTSAAAVAAAEKSKPVKPDASETK